MAIIKLFVLVNNLEDNLARFSSIRIYRSTTTVSGTYTEITTAATRPRLKQGVSTYTYFDESGETSYWYKTDFYNVNTLQSSELSDPILGDNAEVLSGIMTVQELKDIYLFGIDLTDDQGNPYPDIMFDFAIRAAIAWTEHALDLKLRPTLLTGERYDYDQLMWRDAWGFLQLDQYPCLDWDDDIHSIKLFWPSASEAYEFPSEWVRLEKEAGQINLVPTAGSISGALLVSGSVLPTILTRYPYIPRSIEVTYSAGFEAGQVPHDIRNIVGMKACFPVLNVAGDLIIGAGIANYSLSVDSLSQTVGSTASATNSGFGARLVQYSKQLREDVPVAKRFYKNAGLQVG